MNKDKFLKLSKPNLPNTKLLITDDIIKKTGRNYIIKLNYNENKFLCSPLIKNVINLESPHIYPEYENCDLNNALEKISGINKKNFYFSNGSDAILDSIPKTFAFFRSSTPNVLIPDITYARIEITCNIFNLEIRKIKLKKWFINLDEYLKNIDENTSIIYIVNPNMPTGTFIENDELIKFLNKVPKDILVVIDEAYIEYAIGIEKSFIYDKGIINKFDNVIITRTFSKLFALASFRIGYCFSCQKNIEILKLTNQYLPICKYSFQAANAALKDIDYYNEIIKKTNLEKEYLYSELDKLKMNYIKSKGNYIFIDLSNEGYKNYELESFLLNNYGLLIRSIKDYGIRVTVGSHEENQIFVEGVNKFINVQNR